LAGAPSGFEPFDGDAGFIDLVGPVFVRHDDGGRRCFGIEVEERHRNASGFAHGGMLVQDALHLPRPHLVAAGDDHVLLAVDDVEPALLVHEPDVTGVQVASGQRVLGLLRLVPVPGDDLRAAGHELAVLAGGDLVALLVDDLHHGVEDRHADRERPGVGVDRRLGAHRHAVRR